MVPIWVWVLLWIFFFANLSFGVYYVVRHGLDALKKVGETGTQITEITSRMGEVDTHNVLENESPFFTRPLSDAADRYSNTREAVEKARVARDERHSEALKRWQNYSLDDLKTLESQIEVTAQSSDALAEQI